MQRFLLASIGAMFLGSAAAFFLFVPPLSIATVVLILVGLMLMFGLGFQAGARRMAPSEGVADVLLKLHDTDGFKEWENHRNEPELDREEVPELATDF